MQPCWPTPERDSPQAVIGQAQSDGSGSFRIDAPRSSSARNESIGAAALAPGYGTGWVELDPGAERPNADISLRPEQVIHGRLFDLQGRPARSVTVSVAAIRHIVVLNANQFRQRAQEPIFSWTDANDFPGWPKPAITDAEGRFTMFGIGRGLRATLTIRDLRFALQRIEVETDGNSNSKQLTMALQPAQIITGQVTYADTGELVSHARLNVGAAKKGGRGGSAHFQTDEDGRFRVNPAPGDHFTITAYPSNGQPYLCVSKGFDRPKGAAVHSVDLALPRGVVIHGKVTEQGSGKPVTGAWVFDRRPDLKDANQTSLRSSQGETAADGSYQLTAPPGPGYLDIVGPGKDYVRQAIGDRRLLEGRPGGLRVYSNAFILCDPKSGSADLEVNVELRRGVTVRGEVIGSDSQPVSDTWMISRGMLGPAGSWQGWQHGNTRNGRFDIHGLDPDSEVPVHFLEPNRKLGVTAHFSGKAASGGPVTVRLEPCGTATARLIDTVGKPVVGFSASWLIWMVVTPGPFGIIEARKEGELFADAAPLLQVDPINYGHNPVTDAQGRITFPALIPGATYHIIDRTPLRRLDGPQHRKEFTVKPGEVLDLGDILIEKPQVGK